MSNNRVSSFAMALAAGAALILFLMTSSCVVEEEEDEDIFQDDELYFQKTLNWTPSNFPVRVIGRNLISSSAPYPAVYENIESGKTDGAKFQANLIKNSFHSTFENLSIGSTCSIGETDPAGNFYNLGSATFLSSRVVLTAWHVVCSISDLKRVAVKFESKFTYDNDSNRAGCLETVFRVDVFHARSINNKDIGILELADISRFPSSAVFPKLNLAWSTNGFVMTSHIHDDYEHTVVDIGEVVTNDTGGQISTKIISDGTFGSCGAGIFDLQGHLIAVYVGASITNQNIKGVATVNDIIFCELEEYGSSIIEQFLIHPRRRKLQLDDWVTGRTYEPEGTKYEAKKSEVKTDELAILLCLGEGGQHLEI